MWGAVGLALVLVGLGTHGADRWWSVTPGVVAALGAVGMSRLNWAAVPASLGRLTPIAASVLMLVLGWRSPACKYVIMFGAAYTLVWTGIALALRDLVVVTVVVEGTLLLPLSRGARPMAAVCMIAASWLLLGTLGFAMRWLRGQLDAAAQAVLVIQQEAAQAQAQVAAAREQAEQHRAAVTDAALADRVRVQQQIAEQSATLAEAAEKIGRRAESVATATHEMSQAIVELSRTARVTDEITGTVATKAREASTLMEALEGSSGQIMAASDVIQGVAVQTNLLALNATIEAARAGELGRGFAVVAGEVKDLAHQSADNADAITRTLAEVRSQVAAAVSRAAEITVNVGELSSHNGALAAALEQQSTSVREITTGVQESATEVNRIIDEVRALELLSRGG